MTWEQARAKIQTGTDYRDTVEVPFGDPETGDTQLIELTHRLLDETEYWDIEQSVDAEAMEDDSGLSDEVQEAQQTVESLQSKENLSPQQEQELQDALEVVQANQGDLMSNLGEDTFDAILNVGKTCLVPSDEDVDDAWNLSPMEQKERYNFTPNRKSELRDAIKLEMEEMVVEQPYPIKFIVGMKAYSESQSVLGQTDLDAQNPDPNE